MERESKQEIEEKIREHFVQIELLKQQLKETEGDNPDSRKEEDPKPSISGQEKIPSESFPTDLVVDYHAAMRITGNHSSETPLHLTPLFGTCEHLEGLLSNMSLDVDDQDLNGITALHRACRNGSSKSVEGLLMIGADRNLTDNGKNTALHHASMSKLDNEEIVKILINSGLSVDVRNGQGQTPLHLACERSNTGQALTLLGQGADPRLADYRKNNALHYASRQKENNQGLIQSLICIDILILNEQNENGQTPLHVACKEGDHRNVEMLLKKLANFKIEDSGGNNALHYAAMARDPKTLQLVIDKELGISRKNRAGQTPLHLASREGRFGNVEILLRQGAPIYCTDKEGNDALHYAAKLESNKDIIELLIAKGLNVNTENKKGFAAIHFANKEGNGKNVEYLLQRGAKQCMKCQNNENFCK